MADEAAKLRRFKEAVSAETDAQTERMLAEAQAEHDRIIAEAVAEAERRNLQLAERINDNAERELTREISSVELEAQRSVLLRREQLADSVFELVRDKLEAFRKSKDYAGWLLKCADACKQKAPGAELELHIRPDETGLVSREYPGAVGDSSVQMGGALVYVKGTNIVYDFTFDTLFKQERADFCRRAGL
ncbi:MAG: V-type ATP synthase subunit E [Ruminococcus sp.]|nr:V-type ATP synthase subunit E [Ruminococcus sp.]